MMWSVRYRTKACAVSNRTQKVKLLLDSCCPKTTGSETGGGKAPLSSAQLNKCEVLSLMFVAAQTGALRNGILESDAETVAFQIVGHPLAATNLGKLL